MGQGIWGLPKLALHYLKCAGAILTTTRPRLVTIDGISLVVETPLDIVVAYEVIHQRVYERYGYPICRGWKVVDIGAGLGNFSILAAKAGACVSAYEPARARILRANLDLNEVHVLMWRIAVSTLDEVVFGPTDLVKIDTEGHEVEILQNTLDDTWPLVKRIVLEYHSERDCNTIMDILARRGYCVTMFPGVHPGLGYIRAHYVGDCQ